MHQRARLEEHRLAQRRAKPLPKQLVAQRGRAVVGLPRYEGAKGARPLRTASNVSSKLAVGMGVSSGKYLRHARCEYAPGWP